MPHIWPTLLAAAAALVFIPATGHAFEECTPFTVMVASEGRQIEIVDHGAEGVSPGDQRIGVARLMTEDGDDVGEIHWVATVVQPHEDGSSRLISDGVLRLPTGDVMYRMLPEATFRDPDVTPLSAAPVEATRLITGGTGVFAGATGDLAWERQDNDDLTFTMNVTCD
ncbi:MAG: hypothetical protein AAGG65_16735 [Pseudomonadota bacterium]